jgi:hypothetical protein
MLYSKLIDQRYKSLSFNKAKMVYISTEYFQGESELLHYYRRGNHYGFISKKGHYYCQVS